MIYLKSWDFEYFGDMGGCVRPGLSNGRVYMTSEQQRFRQSVRAAWLSQHGTIAPEGPIAVTLTYWRGRPKSRARKGMGAGWLMMKPDADNLAKPILDALFLLPAKRRTRGKDGELRKPGTRWDDGLADAIQVDDAAVVQLTIRKLEANGAEPGFFLRVAEHPEPSDGLGQ